jgi:hypothetical protein
MEIEMYHYLWSFWFRLNNALLRIVVQQDKIRKCNRLSLPPLHKKDKRLENGLWDTIIFFQMKNNQANNAYHKSFDTICDGFFTLVAFCLLDPSREKASGPHFQINESKISDALFRTNVVGGIHPSVTSNPASYPLFLQHILFFLWKVPTLPLLKILMLS